MQAGSIICVSAQLQSNAHAIPSASGPAPQPLGAMAGHEELGGVIARSRPQIRISIPGGRRLGNVGGEGLGNSGFVQGAALVHSQRAGSSLPLPHTPFPPPPGRTMRERSLMNLLLNQIVFPLDVWTKPRTLTGLCMSSMNKLFMALFVNTGIVLLLVSADFHGGAFFNTVSHGPDTPAGLGAVKGSRGIARGGCLAGRGRRGRGGLSRTGGADAGPGIFGRSRTMERRHLAARVDQMQCTVRRSLVQM